jgi:hypothetical protein
MKRLSVIHMIIALACGAAPASAQQTTTTSAEERSVFDDYLNPADPGAGFLRIPGLHFQSSMGFSYATSRAFGDVGMGYYMGHFSYRLGSTVTLNWDVGVGSYMMGGDGMNDYKVLIPNFNLTWKPSDTFMVRLQYIQGSYLNPYYSRRGFGL